MREYLLTLLVAAGATYLLVALTGKIAYVVGAVPPTRDRDVHRAPVPRLGGLAMLGGLLAAMLVASYLPRMSERVFEQSNDAQALVTAAGGHLPGGRRGRHLGALGTGQVRRPAARRRAAGGAGCQRVAETRNLKP